MKLSFVVPAFNEEKYLSDCISSILADTSGRKDVEIVVVNNASTDHTRDIAALFPGIILVDEPQKGLTHARQAGYLASTGELIANVDADSRLPLGWVDKVLKSFDKRPEMAALSGPLVYYDLTPYKRFLVRVFYGLAWVTYAVNSHILHVGSMVQGGNFVVRRSALEEIRGFNLGISFYGEDADLARRLPQAGPVVFTLGLRMFSSARRLKKEGVFAMALKYVVNYLSTILLKRPYSEQYIDIREDLTEQR